MQSEHTELLEEKKTREEAKATVTFLETEVIQLKGIVSELEVRNSALEDDSKTRISFLDTHVLELKP